MGQYTSLCLTTELNRRDATIKDMARLLDKWKQIATDQTKRALLAETRLVQLEGSSI